MRNVNGGDEGYFDQTTTSTQKDKAVVPMCSTTRTTTSVANALDEASLWGQRERLRELLESSRQTCLFRRPTASPGHYVMIVNVIWLDPGLCRLCGS